MFLTKSLQVKFPKRSGLFFCIYFDLSRSRTLTVSGTNILFNHRNDNYDQLGMRSLSSVYDAVRNTTDLQQI